MIVFAALVRLLYFTGLALGDDVFYMSAALALSEGQGWPPLPLHWHTRLGITVPTAAGLLVAGWHPAVFVWLPFVASLAGVWLCHFIAERVAGERAAWVAAILYATFPLEVIYSTHLFPDLVVGTAAALAIWLWVHGLRQDSARAFASSGVAISAAYLCRETAVMLGPVYVVLWIYFGRVWRPRLMWIALAPALTLVIESGLYAYSTGDPLYRWHAIAAEQPAPGVVNEFPVSLTPLLEPTWERPLWSLVLSHEFGLIHLLALPLGLVALWRRPSLRWVALWLLVGIGWLYYGTIRPTAWVPLFPDPRYAAPFTIPAVVLIAERIAKWPRARRLTALMLLVISSLAAASLDNRGTLLSAHRALLNTQFAEAATWEPFEYYGARWVQGLRSPTDLACASDIGRSSVVALLSVLPDFVPAEMTDRRYFVFSPDRRPALTTRLNAAGWREVAEITGSPAISRRWLAPLLRHVPRRGAGLSNIASPPRLVVLERPTLLSTGASRQPD